MLTFQPRFASLTDPFVKVPANTKKPELAEDKIAKAHAAVKEQICKYFKPQTGAFATKLLYSMPIVLLGKVLSQYHSVIAIGLSAGYLWGRGAQLMPQENRVLLLHSTALAFFINAANTSGSPDAIVKVPLNLAVTGTCLTLANMIEADAIAAQAEKAAKKR